MKRIALLCCLTLMALAQQAPVWQGEGPWVIRVYYSDWDFAMPIAAQYGAWEVDRDKGYFVVEADDRIIETLGDQGFALELDEKQTAFYHRVSEYLEGQTEGIPSYPCYRTVEETYASAQDLVANYPDLAQWIDIGDSWEKVQDPGNGYDLFVLKISNQTIPGDKPDLWAMSAIHAREYSTAEVNTRFAEYLLNNYGTDPDATWIVDNRELHLLLHANPDGRKRAEAGASWRKNTNDDFCGSGSSYGIDLNRNFPYEWGCCGGSSGDPCDTTYRGTAAISEPETQGIIAYTSSVLEDQRGPNIDDPAPLDAHGVFLDIHSYGDLVLWSWGFTGNAPPNGDDLQAFGRKLGFFGDYEPSQSSTGLYFTDGTTKDYGYGEFGVASYTVELGTSFFQDCASFESTIFPENLEMLIYAAKACEAPYMLGRGPDVTDFEFIQLGGGSGKVMLNANDTRYNHSNGAEPTQPIQAVEAGINELPQNSASPLVFTATDGTFDTTTEQAEVTIDLNALGPGKHTIYAHAQDTDGFWGVVSAMDFFLPHPNTYIEGYVKDADTHQGLEAQISANGFTAQSDPVSGFYRLMLVAGSGTIRVQSDDHLVQERAFTIAQDQHLLEDFDLIPYCDVFFEDAEAGALDWVFEGVWAVTDEWAFDGQYAFSDSPGGNYENDIDISIVSPEFDLTGMQQPELSFWHRHNLESNYDYGRVEYQLGDGPWINLASFTGDSDGFGAGSWTQYSAVIPEWSDEASIKIRFRLETDSSQIRDGWYVDHIQVRAAGDACMQNLTLEDYLEGWSQPYTIIDIMQFMAIE